MFTIQFINAIIMLVIWRRCLNENKSRKKRFCKYNNIINLILKVIICSIIPNIVFYMCYGKTQEGKYLIGAIKKIITGVIKKVK